MANPFFVALHGVHFHLPDGAPLFLGIDEAFGAETVGIIGRNGSGKSTLGKLVAGELAPGSGRVDFQGQVVRISQETGSAPARSLEALAGLEAPLSALRRLASGESLPEDFDAIGDRWDLESQWLAMLDRVGLEASMAPAALSGGQRMLLALAGGFCSGADLLVLDEPTNHLDAVRRRWLGEEIDRWRAQGRGLLLISHDRALLTQVDRTIETRQQTLRRYGGAWPTVQAQRDAELNSASARLEHARTVRDREQAALRAQAERAVRRNARGTRDAKQANQAKLLIGLKQDQSEQSSGARTQRLARRERELHDEVSTAFDVLRDAVQPEFPQFEELLVPPGQESLAFEDLLAPWGWTEPLTWCGRGPIRLAITGPNGCGKSSLLRMIAGGLAPASGTCRRPLHAALLDQSLQMLDRSQALLDQFADRANGISEGRLRQYLAKAGIGSELLRKPCGELSGGERMRVALLLAMLGQPPAKMLLLDEPTNHLDLTATEALEHMLRSWTGALVVVSHDEQFLGGVCLTHRLAWDDAGWSMQDLHRPLA